MINKINKKIKIVVRLVLAGAAIVGLAGCAPRLSLQQCKTMNWYQLGFADGQQGKYQRNLQKDVTDCARFKLKVNTTAYAKGWRAGTRVFCKPSNGFRLGVNGRVYNNICPSNMVRAFEHAWRRGLRRYCVPETGYNLGRAGKPFPGFCAPGLLVPFRNAYQEGRRVYQQQLSLQDEIAATNNAIANTRNRITQEHAHIRRWRHRLASGLPQSHGRAKRMKMRELHQNIRQARANIRGLERRLNHLYRRQSRLQRQLNRVDSQ